MLRRQLPRLLCTLAMIGFVAAMMHTDGHTWRWIVCAVGFLISAVAWTCMLVYDTRNGNDE